MEIGAGYEASVAWCSTLCQVELEVTQDAVRTVASLAMKKKTGARGLRSILVSSIIDPPSLFAPQAHVRSPITTSCTDSSRNPVTSFNNFNIIYGMVIINTNACIITAVV